MDVRGKGMGDREMTGTVVWCHTCQTFVAVNDIAEHARFGVNVHCVMPDPLGVPDTAVLDAVWQSIPLHPRINTVLGGRP